MRMGLGLGLSRGRRRGPAPNGRAEWLADVGTAQDQYGFSTLREMSDGTGAVDINSPVGWAEDVVGGNRAIQTTTANKPIIVGEKSAYGVEMDGAFMKAPSFPEVEALDFITLEAWVNSKNSLSQNSHIIDRTSSGGPWFMVIEHSTNVPWFRVIIDSGTYNLKLTDNLQKNTWYHIAFTFDGTVLRSYINGVAKETLTADGVLNKSTSPIYISAVDAVPRLNGKSSDLRIWNTARTQQQIQENMNKRLTGNESGLVAYYPL